MKLSAYVLTHNSEQYLYQILQPLSQVADEILVIDSGSNDKTEAISIAFEKVKFVVHPFENFKAQRIFAEEQCKNELILFLDSDEIPDQEFIESINEIKNSNAIADTYTVCRNWTVLGKQVRCIYPVICPDYPIRLYQKNKASFKNANGVHERLYDYKTEKRIAGSINHITFQTKLELNQKLEHYTDLAAHDLVLNKKNIGLTKRLFSPLAAFIKWYFIKSGFKDGATGFTLANYAFRYTLKKYQKAKRQVNL